MRQAVRTLTRTPVITTAAMLCLAFAIASATAVFTIVDGVVLRPLPFRDPSQLVAIWGINPARDTVRRGFSWPDVRDVARTARSLDGVAAMSNAPGGMTLTGRGDPIQIPTRIVSGSFFEVLGVAPALGRVLTADDDRAGSPAAVVISHALWTQRFGANPAVVGSPLTLDGRPFVLAGVAPRTFAYPPDAQMWVTVPHGAPEAAEDRGIGWLEVIGRLKAGVAAEAARADLAASFDELARKYHPSRGPEQLSVEPLQRELLGETRPAMLALLAAVLVLLAVACANVGGLLLVRGASRAHDVAVRVALGAERRHLLRATLSEAFALSMAGGVGGVALSTAIVGALKRLAPPDIPRLGDVALDARILAFAIAVTWLTTIVCALIPLLQAASTRVLPALQQGGRGSTGDRPMLRRGLVAAEIALSVVLMVSAALIARTFVNLRAIDVGFAADRVIAFDVPQPTSRYPTAGDSVRFADRLLPRLAALPGVRRSAAVLLRPLWGRVGMDWPVVIDGQAPADATQNPLTNLEAVSPGYFDTLGIPLLEGRAIDERDAGGRPAAAVVSRSFAQRFWPDGHVLGRRVQFPLPGSAYHRQWFTVVGVVGDAKYRGLRGTRLDLYISAAQCPYPVHQFVVRTDGAPAALVGTIRAEVRAIDPDLPIDDVVVLGDEVAREMASPRFTAAIFAAFAGAATLLAALGLATLIAWQVRQRTREIGIRVALGATGRRVVGMMMADGAAVLAIGVAVGLGAAVGLTTLLQSLLYEVGARDPWTFGAAAAVASIAALVATYVPARRASGIDPLIALRQE